MASLPYTTISGSSWTAAHSVAASSTVVPRRVRTRTVEVSSVCVSLTRNRSGSTETTSATPSDPSTASAVATAWASALVSTPSITGIPSSSRRPAQRERVK